MTATARWQDGEVTGVLVRHCVRDDLARALTRLLGIGGDGRERIGGEVGMTPGVDDIDGGVANVTLVEGPVQRPAGCLGAVDPDHDPLTTDGVATGATRANHGGGTGRTLHAALADRTKEQATEAPEASCADHEEIGAGRGAQQGRRREVVDG